MMHTYTLTGITGRKAAERRTITIASFDWRPRTLLVTALSLPPALIVVIALWPLTGPFALFCGGAIVGAAIWLFLGRTKDSRDLNRFQDLKDRAAARTNKGAFYVGAKRVDPLMSEDHLLHTLTRTHR